jgi:SAM-dependent methyltransferase
MTSSHEKSRQRDREQRLQWLREAFKGSIGDFLDIGCGQGHIIIDAHRLGWNVVGIDIADCRIPAACAAGIEFRKGNLLDISFPDCSFDCVYLDSVLEHVLDPVAIVNEIWRILRPGGILYVGVPNEDSLLNAARKILYAMAGKRQISVKTKPFKRPFHVVGFTERSFRRILRNCGFEFARFRNFAGPDEWRNYKPFTRPFVLHFAMLPLYWLSIPVRKMIYLDAVVIKNPAEPPRKISRIIRVS